MIKMLKERFKRLFSKMLSLSFITWILIWVTYQYNAQLIDMNFLIFTGAIIGIKTFQPKKEEGSDVK